MSITSQEITMEFLKMIMPLFGVLVTFMAYKLSRLIDMKTKDQELIQSSVKINNIVDDVVKDVNQTFTIKQRNNEGKLTEEKAIEAKSLAVQKVKDNMGNSIKDVKKSFKINDSQLNKLIETKIESRLHDLKKAGLLLIFLSFFTLGCFNRTVIAKDIIQREELIKISDERTATWLLDKNEYCEKRGIDKRNHSNKITEEQKRREGLETYLECIKGPKELAEQIAYHIECLRQSDKLIAEATIKKDTKTIEEENKKIQKFITELKIALEKGNIK